METTATRHRVGDTVGLTFDPDLAFTVDAVAYNDFPDGEDEEERPYYDGRLKSLTLRSLRTGEVWEVDDELTADLLAAVVPVEKVPATKSPGEVEREWMENVESLAEVAYRDFRIIAAVAEGGTRRWYFAGLQGRFHSFTLLTWPGNLLVTGDLEPVWWQREPDMLAWAKSSVDDPTYMAGKVVRTMKTREWNREVAEAWVGLEYARRAERVIFDYESITRRGQRLSREEMLADLQTTRNKLLRIADDSSGNAFYHHLYYDTTWTDGTDMPDCTVNTPAFLWAREAVKVALRLIGEGAK